MTEEDIIKLNKERIKIQLGPLYRMLDKDLIEDYKKLVFYDVNNSNKVVSLDDINFKESCIFISDFDIMPFVSIFALQKTSGVRFPDITKSGKFSRIRTDYILSESNEMRYAAKASYDMDPDEDIPDIYKPEYFYIKPLVIWRLGNTVAGNNPQYMYDYCCQRIYERYLRKFADWCFFIGNIDQFRNSYISMCSKIPIYRVEIKQTKKSNGSCKASF